ncbi:MAG: hypothetical protein QM704_25510 [Anaeromyxobacteraceae bacterium]
MEASPAGARTACTARARGTCSSTAPPRILAVPGPAGGEAAGHTWSAASLGAGHSCLLASDHRAFCGGSNGTGQLGLGESSYNTAEFAEIPLDATLAHASDWLAVSAGEGHSCGIRGASLPGSLWCWGMNAFYGLLGQGNTNHLEWPRQVPGAWRAIAAGATHNCGIRDTGALACWGGGGGAWPNCSNGGTIVTSPQTIGADTDWLQVVAGTSASCGIRDAAGTRRLACWGGQFWGTADPCAVNLFAETGWVDVSLGSGHVCGIRSAAGARTLWCWGDNRKGQLGYVTDLDRIDVPTQVGAGTDWATVRAGNANTCATKLDASTWCWGSYQDGVVGDGLAWADLPRSVPVP